MRICKEHLFAREADFTLTIGFTFFFELGIRSFQGASHNVKSLGAGRFNGATQESLIVAKEVLPLDGEWSEYTGGSILLMFAYTLSS